MGLFSGIFKAAGDIVGGVFGGIKDVLQSDIGKALAIATTAYFAAPYLANVAGVGAGAGTAAGAGAAAGAGTAAAAGATGLFGTGITATQALQAYGALSLLGGAGGVKRASAADAGVPPTAPPQPSALPDLSPLALATLGKKRGRASTILAGASGDKLGGAGQRKSLLGL